MIVGQLSLHSSVRQPAGLAGSFWGGKTLNHKGHEGKKSKIAGIAVIARHRRDRKNQKLTAEER